MRIYIAALVALASILSMPIARAQLIVASDDFSTYTPGALAGQTGSATGFQGSWSGSGGTVTPGGALDMTRSSPFDSSAFETHTFASSLPFPADGGAIYFGYTLEALTSVGGQLMVYVNISNSASWGAGVQGNEFAANSGATGGTFVAGTEYQIVTRLQRNDAGDDLFQLWVNPASESDTPVIVQNDFDYLTGSQSFSSLQIVGFLSSTYELDNFMVGETFDSVVAVPEPSTWAMAGLMALAGGVYCRRRKAARV